MKGQSIIEYLATYAWVLVVLTVFIIAIWLIGLNGYNSQPRTQPGSCFVNRPYGSNSTQYVTLDGICNGDLPRYVTRFTGYTPAAFDLECNSPPGTCVSIPSPFQTSSVCSATLVAWSYDLGMGGNASSHTPWTPPSWGVWYAGPTSYSDIPPNNDLGGTVALYNFTSGADTFGIEYNNTQLRFEARNSLDRDQVFVQGSFLDEWTNVALVLDNGVATGYINGQLVTGNSPDIGCINIVDGTVGTWDRGFNGFISNVQIYDISLTPNAVRYLYDEGLGGAPVDLPNLVDWLPLNGNPNDYSGDGLSSTQNNLLYDGDYPPPAGYEP